MAGPRAGPAQRVDNGNLLIQVVEGRLGEVVFSGHGLEASACVAQRIVERVQSRLTPGAALSVAGLTRGVLLAGDLPGISVAANETGGQDNGLTNVVLTVENQEMMSGQFGVDNYGQASIGSERATGWLDFNSAFGFGEELAVLGIVTPDLQFGRVSAALPLNAMASRWASMPRDSTTKCMHPGWTATIPMAAPTALARTSNTRCCAPQTTTCRSG